MPVGMDWDGSMAWLGRVKGGGSGGGGAAASVVDLKYK